MTDLRTGLVEAMARGLHGEVHPATPGTISCSRCVVGARLALDRGLGFLTDNWPKTGNDIEDALMLRVGRSSDRTIETCITTFLAALSDSRDTGEKP